MTKKKKFFFKVKDTASPQYIIVWSTKTPDSLSLPQSLWEALSLDTAMPWGILMDMFYRKINYDRFPIELVFTAKPLLLLLPTSLSLVQNYIYTSVCLTVCDIFMFMWIFSVLILKFDFLLFIYCMSCELFDQSEELKV